MKLCKFIHQRSYNTSDLVANLPESFLPINTANLFAHGNIHKPTLDSTMHQQNSVSSTHAPKFDKATYDSDMFIL